VKRVLIVAGIVAFLAVSLLLARFLAVDGVERSRIEALLAAQARGDAREMERLVGRCAGGCEALARRLRGRGETAVEVVRLDSRTARTLGDRTAPTRVVWQLRGGLTTVQCVTVQRSGSVLEGRRVTLRALSAPIGREAPCRRG
jgi:hypothetical protein